MTKNNFKDNMEKLSMFYPNWSIDLSNSKVMKNWYDALKIYSDSEFTKIVSTHIEKENFSPTVASLKRNKSKLNVVVSDLKVYDI